MFKKSMAILLLFVISFLLIGCDKTSVSDKVPNAPKNTVIMADNVSWDKAKNATGYIVFVNGEEYFVGTTTFSLKGIYMEDGFYEISVKSVNGKTHSLTHSATVNYSVDRTVQREEVLTKLLKISDESYETDMTEEDFVGDSWGYSRYQRTLKQSQKMSVPFAAAGIKAADVETMNAAMNEIEEIDASKSGSLLLLKTEFDKFRNMDITVDQLTYLLISYSSMMIETSLEEYGENQYFEDEQHEMLLMMKQLMIDEKQVFVNGIRSTINFMFGLYDGVKTTMLNSMDTIMNNEVFNANEFIILKNEIVAMLNQKMPTVNDFENIYSIFGIISGKYLELEKTDWDSLMQGSAIMTKNSLTVELLLLGSVDVATVNEVKLIVDKINNSQGFDYSLLIELAEYAIDYADNFYEVNQVVIDALPEINEEAIKLEVYNILEKVILKTMEKELNEEDYAYYSSYVVRFFDNISDFDDAIELIVEKSEDELKYLLEKQEIILEFAYKFVGTNVDYEPIKEADMIEFFNHLLEINKLIVGQHKKSDIETVLKGFKIPMELLIKESFELERTFDATSEVNVLLPHFATVLSNITILEEQLIIYIDEENIVESIIGIHNFSNDTEITEEETIAIAEILVEQLSVFFTEERENLVITSLTVVMDEIMSRQFILDYKQQTKEELLLEKEDLIAEFNLFIDGLDEMATYDFKNLTPSQKEEILDMFQFLKSSQDNYPNGDYKY